MFSRLLIAAAASLSIAALAADPPGDTVLVQKGDVTVTAADFIAALDKLPADQRFAYRADLERIMNAVSNLYISRELAVRARADGIDKEPEIQLRMKLAEEAMLGQVYMERIEKAIVYPDFTDKAHEIYTANATHYQAPEALSLQYLMVSFQGRTEEEALRRANAARARVLAGENFAIVAKEYSNDPTLKLNGGFKQGAYGLLPPETAAVAKTITLKQVSEPIRQRDGYDLIIVDDRIPAHVIPFEKVKRDMVEAEKTKYRRKKMDEFLGTVTKSKEIMIYTDRIALLKTEVDRERLKELHEDKTRRDAEERERLLKDAAKPAGS